MDQIFISYKREERETARLLAHALEEQGWTVWWDPKLRAGERFDDSIEKAITEAKCVIVLWSRLSTKSQYIKDEANLALKLGKLLPVAIDDTELPFRFQGVHTIQFEGWDGSIRCPGFQDLLKSVEALVGRDSIPAGQVERRRATMQPKMASPALDRRTLEAEARRRLDQVLQQVEQKFASGFEERRADPTLFDIREFALLGWKAEELETKELMVMKEIADVDRKLEQVSRLGEKSKWYGDQQLLPVLREVLRAELKRLETERKDVLARMTLPPGPRLDIW